MNLNLTPSLEQIALVKIAIWLFDSHDVIADFASINSADNFKKYDNICDTIRVKVFQLPFSEQLKNKLSGLIQQIALQIHAWLNVHNSRLDTRSVKFYWTMCGTIDYKKTAEMLIQDESIQVPTCCEISNIYCLENEYTLWKEYNNREANELGLSNESFVSAMMFYLEEEFSKLNVGMKVFCKDDTVSPFERAFRLSALSVNEPAVKYLLQKLSPEEKRRTLVETTEHLIRRYCVLNQKFGTLYCRSRFTKVLCFMLSVMTHEQQAKVFNQEPYHILVCLLNWPWQCFFPEVLDRVITVVCSERLCDILLIIHDKIIHDKIKDYDYESLFKIVWQKSPNGYKYSWFSDTYLWIFMHNFLRNKLEEIGMMIVKDMIAIRGNQFIFHRIGKQICRCVIFFNAWDIFEFVIQKCIVTEESLIKFKEIMKPLIIDPGCSAEFTEEMESRWKITLEKITECIRFDERKDVECDQPLY